MKFKIPHTYVLLLCLMIIAALSTWFIPSGKYVRVEQQGRELIDPGSYHTVKADPAGFGDILLAFPRGLIEVADIVFYIFIIGGAFSIYEVKHSDKKSLPIIALIINIVFLILCFWAWSGIRIG